MKKACVAELMKQRNPQLSHLGLAHMYNIEELLTKATKACASTLPPEEIERQKGLECNRDLPDSLLLEIYRYICGFVKSYVKL